MLRTSWDGRGLPICYFVVILLNVSKQFVGIAGYTQLVYLRDKEMVNQLREDVVYVQHPEVTLELAITSM